MRKVFLFAPVLAIFLLSHLVYAGLDLKKLPPQDIQQVKVILKKLTPAIKHKESKAELATLSFQDLYAPLNSKEQDFVKQFLKVKPTKHGIKTNWRGIAEGTKDLVIISGQKIRKNGKEETIPPQFVPKKPFETYEKMMAAMKTDLGKRLYIESGYRSSAYQLYLFMFYLKNHDYSIIETAKWNAFPGYSEHGDPHRQALDFINEEGINGEDNPENFARLPEFSWLEKNARRFGYVLSYPRDAGEGIGFEPWHWHYDEKLDKSARQLKN